MKISDKGAFKRMSAAGLLGNAFRQWDTVRALADSQYNGWLTVRALRPGDKHLFVPTILSCMVTDDCRTFWEQQPVYFQECPAPDAGRVINLEAMPGCVGFPLLYVRYALNDPTNLRHSLEQRGQDAEGLAALHVLQRYMPAEDLDTLRELWDVYPDAIVEASVFSRACGTQNRKTIFWEVRDF